MSFKTKTSKMTASTKTSKTSVLDASVDARRKTLIRQKIVSMIPLFACVLLGSMYIISALAHGIDLKIGFEVIISNATLVGLVATGATYIFTSGSFDLSLGANMLLSAIVGGSVGIHTGSIWAMVLTCIAVAVSLSVLNALLASFFNLPVFIMTIVMMNVYGAISTLLFTTIGSNAKISVPFSMVTGLNSTWFRIALFAAFELFCCFVFYLLKIGRKQKFLGGNPFCAKLSGIKPKSLTVLSFALSGIGIGLAAFSMIVETPTLSASSGSSVGMNMLIALVFGGMSMSGGPGSRMYSALLGAFSMAFLDSLMNIFVTGSWYLQIVKGVLFVIVVFLFTIGKRSKLLQR